MEPSANQIAARITEADRVSFNLKYFKSFAYISNEASNSNPYCKAMKTFQSFTDSIIRALEAKEPDIVNLAANLVLRDLYTGFPSFQDHKNFITWIKDATLKHPYRQTAKQMQWLEIVELQEDSDYPSLFEKIDMAVGTIEAWEDGAYLFENLKKDPDALHFFIRHNGLSDVDASEIQSGEGCLICTNTFDDTSHPPQQAPCGHVLCRPCFVKWLHKSTSAYTCPLCRACVICGRNDCPHHPITRDKAPPLPLQGFLKNTLYRANVPSYGLTPAQYWKLREDTRQDRAMLAWILAVKGGVDQHDPVYARLRTDYGEIELRIRRMISASDLPPYSVE